jgi:hypothetical protein
MTWIRTTPPAEAGQELLDVYQSMRGSYPPEYGVEVPSLQRGDAPSDSIVSAHSLLPEAMRHAFGTHLALISPDLPLTRRQHEMISTVVSALNRCFY